MKIRPNISFAKQLIIYLMIILLIAFLFISLVLANSLQQFIGDNAHTQAKVIARNVMLVFEREISRIEDIPNSITDIQGEVRDEDIFDLPERILKSYTMLIGCSIHYGQNHQKTGKIHHINAFRLENGNIQLAPLAMTCDFCHPDTTKILRRSPQNGYWIYSKVNGNKTIAYCQAIYNHLHQPCGLLKIDFPLKTITDLLCNYKLFKSGYIFVIDNRGNYIAHPNSQIINSQAIYTHNIGLNSEEINDNIINGETGEATIVLNNIKHYLYFTPIPLMNWRLVFSCPYNEILNSSNKLFFLLFICLGLGLIFLFIGITNIVHRLSLPLKQLAYSARRIADGQFDIELSTPKSSKEIQELYDSFRYMQQNIINYIERLQITATEKEQLNSEMSMARRIQERFLPRPITLPTHVELAAELSQCREVGGDLYEFFTKDNLLYFVIGDVSGKGTPAALYMASICKLFRYIASHNTSTAAICNIINKHMCDDSDDDMYITMFMGILDMNTGILTFTNAGHPYPIIIYENGISCFLSKYPDVPIGILEDHEFLEHTHTIHKGTTLLLYTDGITDAENSNGQFYGKEKMIGCIKSLPDRAPNIIIRTLLQNIREYIGKRNQSDDLTVLSIRYNGIPEKKNDY